MSQWTIHGGLCIRFLMPKPVVEISVYILEALFCSEIGLPELYACERKYQHSLSATASFIILRDWREVRIPRTPRTQRIISRDRRTFKSGDIYGHVFGA